MALPRQVPRVGNNVPGQRHGHVPVTQQTVPVIKEIIPNKNVFIADKNLIITYRRNLSKN